MLTTISLILLFDVILLGFAVYLFIQLRNTRFHRFKLESEFIVHRANIEQSIQKMVRDEISKIDSESRRMDFLESKLDKSSALSKENIIKITRKEIQRDHKKTAKQKRITRKSFRSRDEFGRKLSDDRLTLKNA